MREPANSLQPDVDFSPGRLTAELEGNLAWLRRAARGLGFTSADAEDLVQMVAATFIEVMPRFEGRSSLRTFLFGILRRKAAEMRRVARRISYDEQMHLASDIGDGEARLANAQLGRLIEDCIGELPAKQRAAAHLRLVQERPSDDVGRQLGVSANYLGVLINRARAHLRDCVGAHGVHPGRP